MYYVSVYNPHSLTYFPDEELEALQVTLQLVHQGDQDLNTFPLAPKFMLLISMPKKKKNDFKAFLSTNGRNHCYGG